MKKKWIPRFLFLAVTFNILTPLGAMDGTNEVTETVAKVAQEALGSTTESTTKVIEETTKEIVQEAASAISNVTAEASAEATNKVVTETTNGFWGIFSRGWQDIKGYSSWVCGGLVTAGSAARGHYFEKPETWEGFNKGTAARDAFIGLSALFITKHYFDLRAIDMKIGTSEAENACGKNFLFGSWKYKTEGYKAPHDMYQNQGRVKTTLLDEVREAASRIHVLNDAGERIAPKDVTKKDFQEALRIEQRELRKYLTTISYLTDAPKKILELARESEGFDGDAAGESYLWYQNAAFHEDCINYLKTLNARNLNQFGNDLITQKCNSYIKHALFIAPGWSFWRINRWRWGLWYSKASKLYWKVYTRYLRTCALYDIISSDKAIVDPKQPAIERLLEQVRVMMREQDNSYNDHKTKRQQLSRLEKAIGTAAGVKRDYERKGSKDTIVLEITEIEEQFGAISSFLQDNKNKPTNDTAGLMLAQIERKLTSIIHEEKK